MVLPGAALIPYPPAQLCHRFMLTKSETSSQVAESGCQAPADLLQDALRPAAAVPHPGAAAPAPSVSHPSIAAPRPGVPGLSTSAGTLAPLAPLAGMTPCSACCAPDNTLLVAVVYRDRSCPDAETGALLSVHRRSLEVADGRGGVGAARATLLEGSSAVAVWDLSTPHLPRALLTCSGTVLCCAFAPRSGGSVVVCGCADGTLCLWDSRTRPHRYLPLPGAGSDRTAAANVPVHLPAAASSASGLASTQAAPAAAQATLDSAEAIVRVVVLAPQQGGAVGCHVEGGGGRQAAAAALRCKDFTVLVLSASAIVSQWAVRVPAPGAAASDGPDFGLQAPGGTSPMLGTATAWLIASADVF